MTPLRRLLCLLAVVLTGATFDGAAAVVEVAPVTHELAPGKAALSMTVSNRGDAAVTLQVRGFAWTQEHGEDRLVPVTDVIVAPAIFTLAAGQAQVVRALVQAPPADAERTYRLLIDELPAAGSDAQVRMALRISVPVFVHAQARVPAQLEWRVEQGARTLVASNRGGSRERLREIVLIGPSGQRIEPLNPFGPYLLAGAQRRWSIGAAARTLKPGDPLLLTAITDAGRIEVPVVVAP